MKKVISLLVLVVTMLSMTICFAGDVWVQGHYRSYGTWIEGYHRSSPDGDKSNNYNNNNNNPYK